MIWIFSYCNHEWGGLLPDFGRNMAFEDTGAENHMLVANLNAGLRRDA
jgi:hypothetical protein